MTGLSQTCFRSSSSLLSRAYVPLVVSLVLRYCLSSKLWFALTHGFEGIVGIEQLLLRNLSFLRQRVQLLSFPLLLFQL